jgi:hypothetical protein
VQSDLKTTEVVQGTGGGGGNGTVPNYEVKACDELNNQLISVYVV